jgi:hypothetical protein
MGVRLQYRSGLRSAVGGSTAGLGVQGGHFEVRGRGGRGSWEVCGGLSKTYTTVVLIYFG